MSRRSKIILILTIIVIVISVIIYLFFYHNKQYTPWAPAQQETKKTETHKTSPVIVSKQPTTPPATEPTPVTDAEALEKSKIVQLASSFTARLGSYSNQSDYKNIIALKTQATDKMKTWINNFVKQQKAKQTPGEEYWGITTKTVSTKLENVALAEGTAQAVVSTQRHETTDDTAKVYYQNAVLQIVKEGGDWKVDEVVWESK